MESGIIEPDIRELHNLYFLSIIPTLHEAKRDNVSLSNFTKKEVEVVIECLFRELDAKYITTHLPEEPDRKAFNKYLLQVRRDYLSSGITYNMYRFTV